MILYFFVVIFLENQFFQHSSSLSELLSITKIVRLDQSQQLKSTFLGVVVTLRELRFLGSNLGLQFDEFLGDLVGRPL